MVVILGVKCVLRYLEQTIAMHARLGLSFLHRLTGMACLLAVCYECKLKGKGRGTGTGQLANWERCRVYSS